ncbi:MAG: GTP 3',8-cyclase MoaA [Planctomycetota bacterium]
MIDGCGRIIDHLRLSLTDRCNLACRYCAPEHGAPPRDRLEAPFAYAIVHWLATRHGVHHVRLTGGEPLLHPHLIPLVERLSRLGDVHELTLTTNGQALAQQAATLRAAGLDRVNVSLDTLDPQRFAQVTRGGNIQRTLAGIEAVVAAGLTPVRINVVVQSGLNDRELADIAAWGLARGGTVRFLELMPIGPLAHVIDRYLVSAAEILARLSERFQLRPIPASAGQPAVDYAATSDNLRGVVGIIAPATRPFCAQCRRLRVTARGQLITCLHDDRRYDLRRWWDGHRLDYAGADTTLRAALADKPVAGFVAQSACMRSLGG